MLFLPSPPVAAVLPVAAALLTISCLQIFLWSLRASELTGMAFIDTQLYIHQMISVKNFILAADVMKSISLLRYQEESKTLSLVSRVLMGPGVQVGTSLRPALTLSFPFPRMPSLWRSTVWTLWWTMPSWASWVSGGSLGGYTRYGCG